MLLGDAGRRKATLGRNLNADRQVHYLTIGEKGVTVRGHQKVTRVPMDVNNQRTMLKLGEVAVLLVLDHYDENDPDGFCTGMRCLAW